MIKYIGSKRMLVPRIRLLARAIRARTGARTACDVFSGTTRVAQVLKREGFFVTANDLASYSEVLATAFIEADGSEGRLVESATAKIAYLNALPGVDGYFAKMFCEESRYFQPFNGRRIDAIRMEIDRIADSREERAVLLTSLLLAADKVDSTTGLQMAYLKSWAPRSFNLMELKMPALIAGGGAARRGDANEFARTVEPMGIAYLDPPYNQHSYYSNYHVWETLVRNDEPEAYGVAKKRVDCRDTKSAYNVKAKSWLAFEALVRSLPAQHLIVSFSDEGYFTYDAIAALLESSHGDVAAVPVDFQRYVGAKIGIHDRAGKKVGTVSHTTNREFLFVAGVGASGIVADAVAELAATG